MQKNREYYFAFQYAMSSSPRCNDITEEPPLICAEVIRYTVLWFRVICFHFVYLEHLRSSRVNSMCVFYEELRRISPSYHTTPYLNDTHAKAAFVQFWIHMYPKHLN